MSDPVKKFNQNSVRQCESKDLTQVDLPLVRQPVDVDLRTIVRQSTHSQAIELCRTAAGIEDKEIYMQLGIDAAVWSRIKSGKAHFPHELYVRYQEYCGNHAPFIWVGDQLGYDMTTLRRKQSETERERDAALIENAELKKKLEHFKEFSGQK